MTVQRIFDGVLRLVSILLARIYFVQALDII